MRAPTTPKKVEALNPRDRLESWKEIAAYLRRSERTVRRWEEKEGLPVHRLAHDKRGSVYAFSWELDAWRESRRQLVDSAPTEAAAVAASDVERRDRAGTDVDVRSRRAFGIASLATLLLIAGGAWWLVRPAPRSAAATPNPEAVRLVELARFSGNAGRTQVDTGLRYYQEAVRLDPSYAPAWTGLAVGHFVRIWFGEVTTKDAVAQARHEAEQALRLDPTLGFAWSLIAAIDHFVEWNHEAAETKFRKALELSPRNPVAQSWLGDFLLDMRRFEESRMQYKRAQDLAPRWLEPIAFTGNSYFFTGNPALAVAEYRRLLDSEPNYGLGVHFLGRALVAQAEYEQGIAQLRKADELLGRISFSMGDLGYGLARGGKRDEAEALRDELIRRRSAGYFPAFPITVIELGLGHTESALDWLERAAEERNLGFYLPSVDPNYDAVRDHPRFKAVMKRANLDRVAQ